MYNLVKMYFSPKTRKPLKHKEKEDLFDPPRSEPGGIRTHDLLIRSPDITVAQPFIDQHSQPTEF